MEPPQQVSEVNTNSEQRSLIQTLFNITELHLQESLNGIRCREKVEGGGEKNREGGWFLEKVDIIKDRKTNQVGN